MTDNLLKVAQFHYFRTVKDFACVLILSLRTFSLSHQETLYPLTDPARFLPSPPALSSHFSVFIIHLFRIFCINFVYVVCIIHGLLKLPWVTWHVFKSRPGCSGDQYSIPLCRGVQEHRVGKEQFLYPLTFRLFLLFHY